jgi:hypothetical protein
MIESSDLHAAVTRLIVGIAYVVTAAALMVCVAAFADRDGNLLARTMALWALGFTLVSYKLQLGVITRQWYWILTIVIAASWLSGAFAMAALLIGGR